MSKKIKYKGNTIEDAINKACKALNLSSDELEIEIISTGSAGIFGLCKKQAVISVTRKISEKTEEDFTAPKEVEQRIGSEYSAPGATIKEVEKKTPRPKTEQVEKIDKTAPEPEKKSSAAREEKKASPPHNNGKKIPQPRQPLVEPSTEILNEIKMVLSKLLELMNFSSEIEITSEPGKVNVEINRDFSEYAGTGDVQLIDGLQYILRKIIGKKFPEKIIIFLDCAGFRARRKIELEETARQLAEEVKTGGKNRIISSINPAERRIVHMALQGDKAVRSRSIGDGLFKKILIYPTPSRNSRKTPKGKRKN